MTQILARTSSRLDGRHRMQMTPKLYMYTIVPIGVFYSLSLVCSNEVYLYLNVAFIQMLKGTAPVAVLIALSSLGLESPNISRILNLCVIVFGVGLTSLGEIEFQLWGFLLQIAAVFFEAFRLAFTQKLLKDEKYKMDPLVSLYYFAPCCAGMICMLGLFMMGLAGERTRITWEEVNAVGVGHWILNGLLAIGLNVASVLLIGKTSSLILTLCGVLKSICLMVASVIIWSTVVTPMQFIGNFIAMGGLVYYNLGGKK
ncbi:MAG: hypothetical protein Q9226_006625, partial [Calogaya cf. arnoldii]